MKTTIMNKRKLFILFVLFEFIIIGLLFLRIKYKKNTLGVSINLIDEDFINGIRSGDLNNFYEPEANTSDHPPTWLPFKATYQVNGDTLNSINDFKFQKDPDTYRIITLGDSFTFGVGVNTIDTYPEVLNNNLNLCKKYESIRRFEVINLGVGGYDFEYAVERYRYRGTKYNPNLVTWLFIDPLRITEQVIPLNNKILKQLKETGKFDDLVKKGKYYQSFIEAMKLIEKKMGVPNILEYQKKAILKLNNYYQGKLVIILPNWIYSDPNVFSLVEEIQRIRPNTYLLKLGDQVFQPSNKLPDSHPNEKGHRMLAEEILNYLKITKLIPCE